MFLKIYSTLFDDIVIIFMDQNGRPLKIEDKVTLTLLINNRITLSYRTKKIHQRIRIVNRENYVQQIREKIIVIATKIGLDAAKPVSKNVFHKTFEATGELLENKIFEKIVKPNLYLKRIQEMLRKQLFHQRKDKKY